MAWEATHGYSKHPHYKRWDDMVQRCYNSKDVKFELYGAKGIIIAAEWDRRNPKGVGNFITWLERELAKRPEEEKDKPFKVARRKVTDNYSPETCYITTNVDACQKRSTCILTFEKVVELRRFKRENPGVTLIDMCIKFGIEHRYTLSRCLKGISWPNVNEIEPPISDLGGNCRKKA